MATIPVRDLPTIHKRVAHVNRRAEKLGVEGVELELGEPYTYTWHDDNGFEHVEEVVEVTVHGPVVRVEGWSILGAIDHEEGITRSAPDRETENFPGLRLSEYTDVPTCEHCHTNRDRLTTYVLGRTDTGELRQVGSTCLNDFLGHTVSLWVMEAVSALEDDLDSWGGDGGPLTLSLKDFLTVTHGLVRSHGWVSRKKAQEEDLEATVSDVWSYFGARYDEVREKLIPGGVTDHDREQAEAAMDWAANLTPDNDYLANLLRIAENGYVTDKSGGFAASIIPGYRRAMEREQEKAAERQNAEPVPEGNARITVTGTVVKQDTRENAYGVRYVMVVLDDRGFKVWGTEPSTIQPRMGDRVTFVARVERSDRDDYFGFFNRPTKAAIIEEDAA